MYSEFFDQLGGAGGLPGRRAAANNNATSAPSRPPALVSFKAGKMNLTQVEESDATKYRCEPDVRRGEVRLVYQTASSGTAATNGLYWQWYDRRDDSLVDSKQIAAAGSTWEKVELPASKKHARDRVYVWTQQDGTHDMYWMQDASEEKDEEVMVKVNQYLADPASAAPVGTSTTTTTEAGGTGAAAASGGSGGSNPASQSQVDALSNILQNLGMPQSEGSSGNASDAAGGTAAAPSGGATGMLTLADLQGAMAGIQSQQAAQQPVPLNEVVTPAAISSLMENDQVRERLIALLPEEQRSNDLLEENLRSPQIQQTLRALTQALLPDGAGNMDSFYSVLANFSLDPADGQEAMAANNPIQAFLDCILASVKKDGGEDKEDETMAEQKQGE